MIQHKPRSPRALGVIFMAVALLAAVSLACQVSFGRLPVDIPQTGAQATARPSRPASTQAIATQNVVPTLTLAPSAANDNGSAPSPQEFPQGFTELYQRLNPGVVNIQVIVNEGGQTGAGAGSGFIIDEQGHIVTNNHVVSGATDVTVLFFNGFQAPAEVVGTDDDSDLAVIRVDQLAEGAHPLPLGDSDKVMPGEWVLAIGNPFGFGSSMSFGIVSGIGRVIESGVTPFSIPQAIQTDAAINPGNSGGPLLDLNGEVIGVNAQIRTSDGVRANSGVGFAIPSNIVRRVAPVLIEQGAYSWPWLGVSGAALTLPIVQANNLESQQGAYIDEVDPSGPSAAAGLQGSTGTREVGGIPVPVGGDVVVEADGNPITSFNDLLIYVSQKNPGDTVNLVVLRNGERVNVNITLAPRPQNFQPQQEFQLPTP